MKELILTVMLVQMFHWPAEEKPVYKDCHAGTSFTLHSPPEISKWFSDLLKWYDYSAGVSWFGQVPPNIMLNVRVAWSGKSSDGGFYLHANGCSIADVEHQMRVKLEQWYGSPMYQPSRQGEALYMHSYQQRSVDVK